MPYLSMAIAAIQQWLSLPQPTYAQGLTLYKQYGASSALLALFNSGTSSFHIQKLTAALIELNNTKTIVESTTHTINRLIPPMDEFRSSRESKKVAPDFDAMPDAVKTIMDDKTALYKQSQHLHFKLFTATTDKDRRELALQILNNMERVNELWHAIDTYTDTGNIPEIIQQEAQKSISELSILERTRLRSNLPTYITKAKKKLEMLPEGEKKAKKTQELQIMQSKLIELKKILGESTDANN